MRIGSAPEPPRLQGYRRAPSVDAVPHQSADTDGQGIALLEQGSAKFECSVNAVLKLRESITC